jgi:tripeptide aminopeptidase
MTDITDRMLDLAIEIQQIPAPTFAEGQRAGFVYGLFLEENLADVSIDRVGNVYGRLMGSSDSAPLIVSAHLDTVFPIETNLQVTRQPDRIAGPGIGDNSLGVAGLFGLLWALRERKVNLPGDVWLVANVCEEGLGDLHGMRAVVERFGGDVLAYLVLEGMALGHIYHRALGVSRYRISIKTAGGHSWIDYGRPSAVHELASLITNLTSMALPFEPRTTINVGRIEGGTSVNTVAAEAHLELDLRSESAEVLFRLVRKVEVLANGYQREGVNITMENIGQRPAGEIPADHHLVLLAEACLREQGLNPVLTIGSTDANIPLSRGYPAICLGITSGAGAHTILEFAYTEPATSGIEQLLSFVSKVWDKK